MNKYDVIELSRGYLGIFLITLDALNGWKVTNFIINVILGKNIL